MNNIYYATVMNFPDTQESCKEIDNLRKKYKGDMALVYAEQWDDGQELEITDVSTKACGSSYETIVSQDNDYVLIYDMVCCDYLLKRKLTQAMFEDEDERLNGKLSMMLGINHNIDL